MFTGDEGTIIYESEAVPLTAMYREEHGSSFKAQFFGKDKIKELIDSCGDQYIGLRIYNAQGDDGFRGFVLVGVKADENDLYEQKMLASGPACPPSCAPSSPLNG
ncbi:hypothetical protein [Hymenobacter algoricola]|uniref:Uncharacterized protein n=1 Tax=Hymenobacter algoricola TaxID=486267 RepID=A0ABP7NET4_9BACT